MGGRRAAPALAVDMAVKPRAPTGSPPEALRPSSKAGLSKASSVGALARQPPGATRAVRRPAPKCLFEGATPGAKVARHPIVNVCAPPAKDELIEISASLVLKLVMDAAFEIEVEDRDLLEAYVDEDDEDEREADAVTSQDKLETLKSRVFESLLCGADRELIIDALGSKSLPAEVVVQVDLADEQLDADDEILQNELGAFGLDRPSPVARSAFAAPTLMEDLDEVVSICSEDALEDESELEAMAYVHMAMNCAKNIISRGIELDLADFSAEQELDDMLEGHGGQPVGVPFHRRPSVGSWMMLLPPAPFEEASCSEPRLPAVTEVLPRVLVPFSSMPSVASWLRPTSRRFLPFAGQPQAALASPHGQPTVFAPAEAVEVAATQTITALALPCMTPSASAAAVFVCEAVAAPTITCPPTPGRTPPGHELDLSPLASDNEPGEQLMPSSPSGARPSPLASPSGPSRMKRRVIGAVIRPDSLKAELLEMDCPNSPRSPANVSRSKVNKSFSNFRLKSPAGGLGPLKEPLGMFRMDLGDADEDRTSPMVRQSSFTNMFDALGTTDIHNLGDDSGTEAERPHLRFQCPKELGPLSAPKVRQSLHSAMALDLGLNTQRGVAATRSAPPPAAQLDRSSSLGALRGKDRVMKSSASGTVLPKLSAPVSRTRPLPWAVSSAAPSKQRMWSSGSTSALF